MLTKQLTRSPLRTDAVVELRAYASGKLSAYGGGKQTKFNIAKNPQTNYSYTWNELAEKGYVKIVIKKSPNGKHSDLVNKIIQK